MFQCEPTSSVNESQHLYILEAPQQSISKAKTNPNYHWPLMAQYYFILIARLLIARLDSPDFPLPITIPAVRRGGSYIVRFGLGRPGCCKPPPVTTRKSHIIPTRQKLRPDGHESPQESSKTAKMPKRTPTRPPKRPQINPQTVEILK